MRALQEVPPVGRVIRDVEITTAHDQFDVGTSCAFRDEHPEIGRQPAEILTCSMALP